eukprot:TRINITY_DN6213_c0_g1_i1.p1 TRINITY_DN6213_c0_g1~~TRINITY_DN6213_c0_g1_i1.p1  ORF type:complete len:146 (+),score=20.14 TRINITY_DN6213_c0_g1_i1:523-960(+)
MPIRDEVEISKEDSDTATEESEYSDEEPYSEGFNWDSDIEDDSYLRPYYFFPPFNYPWPLLVIDTPGWSDTRINTVYSLSEVTRALSRKITTDNYKDILFPPIPVKETKKVNLAALYAEHQGQRNRYQKFVPQVRKKEKKYWARR